MVLDIKSVREFVRNSGLFDLPAQTMADMALRSCQSGSPELYLLMSLTVQALSQQHVCWQMEKFAGTTLESADKTLKLTLPSCREWCKALEREEFRSIVRVMHDRNEEEVPVTDALLVIDRKYGCYLQRQWLFERSIANGLLQRAAQRVALPELPEGFLHNLVDFFPDKSSHQQVDCQQLAVMAALRHKLMVLTGGPGTGKTTVAAAILAMKLYLNDSLRILLAAPTAKAARRLVESLQENLPRMRCSESIKNSIANLQATTIHQLLGYRYGSNEFKFNAQNFLECDLLLVDECSMVPQRLMAQLIEALPPESDLILLGDRYQLASVEAGSVLADICDSAGVNRADSELAKAFYQQTKWELPEYNEFEKMQHPLAGTVVELLENHRFVSSSRNLGIAAGLIRNLDRSDTAAVAEELAALNGNDYEFIKGDSAVLRKLLQKKLAQVRLSSGESFFDLAALAASGSAVDRSKAFKLLNTFKVLSPTYKGLSGIDNINKICMEILNLRDRYQPGAPLMIRQNSYRLGLFNGDIGIVGCDCSGEVKVFFEEHTDGFDLKMLPEHELVFAMSVHKSQGSGFDEVLFIMPPTAGELMNCEMVYTAMTRAKKQLCCVGSVEVLAESLKQRTSRMSDLTSHLVHDLSEALL